MPVALVTGCGSGFGEAIAFAQHGYQVVATMRKILVLLFVALGAVPSLAAEPRPNIVLIMTDDLGWADLTSYGAPDIRTPNIDSLARDGVRMTDFYSNGVLCTPTRAGFISGRYQQRYGLETALPNEAQAQSRGLHASGLTLPQQMRDAGYATALVGKWHLGYRPDQSPNAHGRRWLHDRSDHRTLAALHRTERQGTVLHRRGLQRAALALPAAASTFGGA